MRLLKKLSQLLCASALAALSMTVAAQTTGVGYVKTVAGDAYDIEDTVRGWFPELPAEVTYVLDKFFQGLRCGTVADEHETYLGVTVA